MTRRTRWEIGRNRIIVYAAAMVLMGLVVGGVVGLLFGVGYGLMSAIGTGTVAAWAGWDLGERVNQEYREQETDMNFDPRDPANREAIQARLRERWMEQLHELFESKGIPEEQWPALIAKMDEMMADSVARLKGVPEESEDFMPPFKPRRTLQEVIDNQDEIAEEFMKMGETDD